MARRTDAASNMARRIEGRALTACVVGLSGTEKEKGVTGIGKSCLCNRFMDPRADSYHTDHISVLSQSDFGGQVVNNDHYLYWGEVSKTTDEGIDHNFHVIEQTEFVDDSSFQPFKCGKTEPYYKRCSQVRLQSAEKLKYICKTQLGLEHEFEQVLMPDGKLVVDGFLCLFDVSLVHDRTLERQVEYTTLILSNLLKTKKPIVLVTTKHDDAQESHTREVEKLLSRKEFRNVNIPVVETSALQNVNVELAFIALAQLIDKTTGKARLKCVGFAEASATQKERREVAREAYLNLTRSHVTDHKALWTSVLCKIKQNDNYVHFQELCGTDQAKRLFQRHVLQLKEQYLQRRQDRYLDTLAKVLTEVLPDLATISDRSWPATLQWFRRQDFFPLYFVVVPQDGSWRSSDFIESNDARIPMDLMEIREAELVYRNHVNGLRAEQKRIELMSQFKHLLEKNHNLTGKSLAETAIFFLGHQCFSGLSEEDKALIYEQHQEQLKEQARADFIELLQEHAHLFSKFEQSPVTEDDLTEIHSKLAVEPRFKALGRLENDRRVILLNHLGFVQGPSREKCPYRERCMENQIAGVLATKAHRPQSWSRNSQFLLDPVDNRLNLVLLGAAGLSEQLAREIRLQCVEDEYTLDGEIFSLDYRPIDGDVSLPQNSFKTCHFKPHGCFCVYNSLTTLMYLIDNLRKTLMNDAVRADRMPFQGLPVVIVLAHNPDLQESDLLQLRDEGQQLSDRLQCPFIDIPSSLMVDEFKRFHQDQIALAMHNLVKCIQHRSSFVQPWQIAESIEPDIRVLMCFMCGDGFLADLPLAPLLNHQCCYTTTDKFPTITLETYLDDSKRKVEVTVTSYHGGTQVRDDLYHGYVLVYSAKRRASLHTLRTFAYSVPPVPTLMIAVSEGANAFFSSEAEQSLIVEGNSLADKLSIRFMITCTNFRQQTASYTPFFKECWDRKTDTEHSFQFTLQDPGPMLLDSRGFEQMRNRPPATLPKTLGSSASNSMEAVYDRAHSDSDPEERRTASASPTVARDDGDDLYREVDDTEHLLKPSQLKDRRALYTGLGFVPPFLAPKPPVVDRPKPKRLLKSSTLPTSATLASNADDESTVWENQHTSDKRSPPAVLPKPPRGQNKPRIGTLDFGKFSQVRKVIESTLQAPGAGHKFKAPLATPERIDVIGDYAQVKDALPVEENAYASVADALPTGRIHRMTFRNRKNKEDGSDSDSEANSLDSERRAADIYSRVNRRPTPHKKRGKKPGESIPVPPPLPPYSDDRQLLLEQQRDQQSESDSDVVNINSKQDKRTRNKFRPLAELQQYSADGAVVLAHGWSDSTRTESPNSKGSMEDDGSYEVNTSGEFGPKGRLVEKSRDQKKQKEEDKRRRKEEERRQKEAQKLKKKGKLCRGVGSWGTIDDQRNSETDAVPLFVQKCVAFIEEEGLAVEGLYRVPGNKAQVDTLLDRFIEEPGVDIRSLDLPVNAVATALKHFFSELISAPVVPNSVYDALVSAAGLRDNDARLQGLDDILEHLPNANFLTLKFLVSHLVRVAEHSRENSMTSQNLAICWWPTLLRPDIESLNHMAAMSKFLADIVQTLVDEHRYFFQHERAS